MVGPTVFITYSVSGTQFQNIGYYCSGGEPGTFPFSAGAIFCRPLDEGSRNPRNPQCPSNMTGSVINIDRQVLGENVEITGSEFLLSYFTDRDPARKVEHRASFSIPSQAASTTTAFELHITYDGATDVYNYPNIPGLAHEFIWDGKDRSGNPMSTPLDLHVEWKEIPDPNRAYNIFQYDTVLGAFDAAIYGLGGWTLSGHHFFLKELNNLYYGSGDTVNAKFKELANGNLQVIDPKSDSIFIFDPQGKHLETRTKLNGKLRYQFNYTALGYLDKVVDQNGNTTQILRDPSGLPTGIQSPDGLVTQLQLNSANKISAIINPANEAVELTYYDGGQGLLSSYKKPQGQVINFTYDALGRLNKDAHVGGPSLTLNISGTDFQKTVETVSEEGRVNLFDLVIDGLTFDAPYTRTRTSSDGTTSTWQESAGANSYSQGAISRSVSFVDDSQFGSFADYAFSESLNEGGVLTDISRQKTFEGLDANDPHQFTSFEELVTLNGSETFSTNYDKALNRWIFKTPKRRTYKEFWDDQDRVKRRVYPFGYQDVYNYDSRGRVRVINSSGRRTVYSYNQSGFLSRIKDAADQITRLRYDLAGRLTKQILPDNRQINYSYDKNGNLTSLTPPGREAHQFVYYDTELVNTYTPPALSGILNPSTTYTYDKDKLLKSIVKPSGAQITYDYHPGKTLLSSVTSAQGSYQIYSYDLNANPSYMVSPYNVATSMVYQGSLLSSEYITDNSTGASLGSFNLEYDGRRNLQKIVVMSGLGQQRTLNYRYDKDGLMIKAGAMSLQRDAKTGLVTSSTLKNLSESFSYNNYGELTGYTISFNGSPIYAYSLTRDTLGRIDLFEETAEGVTASYDYNYDLAGRLATTLKDQVEVTNLTYDENSNRIQGKISDRRFNASFDAQDRIQNFNRWNFQFNSNGEVTKKFRTNSLGELINFDYQFDDFGSLTQISKSNGDVIQYRYDGRQRKSQVFKNSALLRSYVYLDQTRMLAEQNSSGGFRSVFVWGEKPNTPEYLIRGGQIYKLIVDPRGSVRLVVNAETGEVVSRMSYDEFGRRLSGERVGFQPFQFAGGRRDIGSGLLQFGARHYDPVVGRWISKDPIGFDGGDTNLYGYVLNDPINRIDPTGLDWVYNPRTGAIHQIDSNGNRIPGTGGDGYSGAPGFRNNPDVEKLPNQGPIPRGNYTINPPINSPNTGPNALPLTPSPGTNTFGRNNFQIHGDNSRGDQSASTGCIVLGPGIRNQIINSGDNNLRVGP